jgi:hypothetical protein
MILYLLVLIGMVSGATVLAVSLIQNAMQSRGLTLYDARGFYLVILVFITFVLTSLAYFWGEARFLVSEEQLNPSLIGVLITLCCCLAGLGYGLFQLKEVDS